MIELSPNTALMLYLGGTLTVILGIWICHHYRIKKKKIFVDRQELLVCEYCQSVYLADSDLKVSKCPQCHSFNKSNSFTDRSRP